MSGVTVAQMIRSRSSALSLALASAFRAASYARCEDAVPSSAILRSRMPVRDTIHSSDVSTIDSSSALVKIRSGTAEPVPKRPICIFDSGMPTTYLAILSAIP